MSPIVTLSSGSVYPEPLARTFEVAAELGYDGIEVMVQAEAATQDADTLRKLIDTHGVPVHSIHSPCLLLTARVWTTDPLVKLSRSIDLAEQLGAEVVVVHPPFLWQRSAAPHFVESVQMLQERTAVTIAVENMFPLVRGRMRVNPYRPHWNPVSARYANFTLDLSHTAASGIDALELARHMGNGLAHVHLADGSGAPRDEHLIPGRGGQPCREVLELLVQQDFAGAICVEVNTRGGSRQQRVDDLVEALEFARAAVTSDPGPAPD